MSGSMIVFFYSLHIIARSADVRITEESQGLQLRADSGVTNETICCPNNATVFFPLSGISATTSKDSYSFLLVDKLAYL